MRDNIIIIESGAIFSSTCAIISADAGPYGSWAGMIANNGTRRRRREDFTQVFADVIFFSHKLAEEKFLAVEEIVSTSVNKVRVATYGCGGNLDAIYEIYIYSVYVTALYIYISFFNVCIYYVDTYTSLSLSKQRSL